MERRKIPRISLSWLAHIDFNNRSYPCCLKNLNNKGAFLEIDYADAKHISTSIQGQAAVLTIRYSHVSDKIFTGQIVRVEKKIKKHHGIAIEFVFETRDTPADK